HCLGNFLRRRFATAGAIVHMTSAPCATPLAEHRLDPYPSVSSVSICCQCALQRSPRATQHVSAMSEGTFACGDVQLQRGGTLRGAQIVYKTFGALSPRKDNAIVYPTSYSAQHSDIEWLVSPNHCLDPTRYFVVIPNMFGNGLSSSPSNTPDYPEVTT